MSPREVEEVLNNIVQKEAKQMRKVFTRKDMPLHIKQLLFFNNPINILETK